VKNIISLVLIGILSLPSAFGLNHFLFEDHFECFEENVHFHETEIDCCTCDFIRLDIEYSSDNFNYSFNDFSAFYKQDFTYNEIIFSNFSTYFDSRGPPLNS
jgi:hypothetical protein